LLVEILEPAANSKLRRLEVARGNVAPGDEVQGFLIRRGSDTGHVLSCSTEPTGDWTCRIPPGLELEEGDWQVFILASAGNEAAASGFVDFQIGETVEQAETPISIGSGDCSGCSTASDLPLGLGVLALLWMSRRRGLKQT
jgi:MYXO-CTERM domain-containing protein